MYRLLFILIFVSAAPAFAQTDIYQSKWDIYLDHAYELTYWDDKELQTWITEREKEFGQSLSQFADTWHEKIKAPTEKDGASQPDSDRFPYPEQVYKRLAVAELLLYLKSQEQMRLEEAVRIMELLKSKREKTEIAFWYYFIRAHEAISYNNFTIEKASEQFVRSIFRIWLDVILPLEEVHDILNIPDIPVSIRDFSFSLPYLYENIADIILRKAIIQCELPNTGSLGIIIRGLNDRLSIQKGYAEKVKTIVNRMSGPKSDIYHLNFTVYFLEAEEYRFITQNKLNEEGPSSSSEETFKKSSLYYRLAYKWANTRQAQAAVISDYFDLVSFTFSRLAEKEKIKNTNLFAKFTRQDEPLTIETAIALFEELARPEVSENEWRNNGFFDRKDYLTAMHSLWNSIAELSLWSAYYHEKTISSKDIENYSDNVISWQAVLLSYLNFFERNLKKGYPDVIPENAYFNAAEAAAKLSHVYHMLAPYSPGMDYYYRDFARLLQYVEIFPYNPEAIIELAQRLNEVGQPGLYVQYVLPLARRVKDSNSIQMWKKNNTGSEAAVASLEKLQRVMPEIILKANTLIYLQGKGDEIVKEDIKMRLKEIQEESKPFLKDKEMNLESDNLNNLKDNLNKLIQYITSQNTMKEGTGEQKFIEEIKKLKGEVQELQEAEQIIADLPEYIEISKKIRKDLSQKIDHPIHTILRQFFHKIPLENQKYYQILGNINKDKN